jgi:hypothetical protein
MQLNVPAPRQKCRSARKIISLHAGTRISLTTVAGQSPMDLSAEALNAWSSKRFHLPLRRHRRVCHRESLRVAPRRLIGFVRE